MKGTRNVEVIEQEIEAVCALGRARLAAAQDPCIRGLRCCEVDWLDQGEQDRLAELQLEWTLAQPSTEELRVRVALKHAARVDKTGG